MLHLSRCEHTIFVLFVLWEKLFENYCWKEERLPCHGSTTTMLCWQGEAFDQLVLSMIEQESSVAGFRGSLAFGWCVCHGDVDPLANCSWHT